VDPAALQELEHVDPSVLEYYTTSQIGRWREVDRIEEIQDALLASALTRRVRHLLRVEVADDPGAPGTGFVYREVNPDLTDALAYCQMHFDVDAADPNTLRALAVEIAQRFEVHTGIGGYAFTWSRRFPQNAFRAIYHHTRRFIGLDVQMPEWAAWHARDRLPSTSWIHILGDGYADDPLEARVAAYPGLELMELANARLVIAGPRPQIGDLHFAQNPTSLIAAAQALEPRLLDAPPPFPGPFAAEDARRTAHDWQRRLLDPEVW